VHVPTAIGLLVLGTAIASTPGCFWNPDIDDMVDALEIAVAPAELDPQVQLRLGRATMGMARTALRWADHDDPDAVLAGDILDGIREVHLGIYEVWGLDDVPRLPRSLVERLDLEGWNLIVEARDWRSAVWVLSQIQGDEVRGLYVVSLEADELVVVRLHGDLTRAIDAAVRGAMRGDGELSRGVHASAAQAGEWN
jgi:hypothetical protein